MLFSLKSSPTFLYSWWVVKGPLLNLWNWYSQVQPSRSPTSSSLAHTMSELEEFQSPRPISQEVFFPRSQSCLVLAGMRSGLVLFGVCGTAQPGEEGPGSLKTSQKWLMMGSWLKTEILIDFAQWCPINKLSRWLRRRGKRIKLRIQGLRGHCTASGHSEEWRSGPGRQPFFTGAYVWLEKVTGGKGQIFIQATALGVDTE